MAGNASGGEDLKIFPARGGSGEDFRKTFPRPGGLARISLPKWANSSPKCPNSSPKWPNSPPWREKSQNFHFWPREFSPLPFPPRNAPPNEAPTKKTPLLTAVLILVQRKLVLQSVSLNEHLMFHFLPILACYHARQHSDLSALTQTKQWVRCRFRVFSIILYPRRKKTVAKSWNRTRVDMHCKQPLLSLNHDFSVQHYLWVL